MCPTEELEALVAEKLDDETAERVRAHVAGCASCQAELKWLAAEAELMARKRAQQPEVSPAVWQGIAERIAQPQSAASAPMAAPTPIRVPSLGHGRQGGLRRAPRGGGGGGRVRELAGADSHGAG